MKRLQVLEIKQNNDIIKTYIIKPDGKTKLN